jgi:hypothetical protein
MPILLRRAMLEGNGKAFCATVYDEVIMIDVLNPSFFAGKRYKDNDHTR